MLTKRRFATYNRFISDAEDRIKDIAKLLTTNETIVKSWDYDRFEIDKDSVYISFSRYAGCGDYDYKHLSVTIDELTSKNWDEVILVKFKK